MLRTMQPLRIDLFEWLLKNASKTRYNLAFNNIHGLTLEDYQKHSGFTLPKEFDLGINAQYGAVELTQMLCDMYHCLPENIITTTGASEANFLVFSSLLDTGDEVVVEQPGYQPMWLTPEMLGARCIYWPREFQDKFRVNPGSLQNVLTDKTKLVVLTNLHNPSGILTDKNTIKTIASIAEEYNAFLLVDEIFLDGSFTPQSSSFGLSNVIITSSPTKIYGLGGLHTGWIVAPNEIAERFQRLKAHSTGASSYVSEILTANVLKTARMDLIKRFHKRSKTNFDYLGKWFDSHNEWFEWVRPDGGIICFPKFSMRISSLELCKYLLRTQKILLNPGVFFNREGFLRMSYGCEPEVFQEALDALERGIRDLKTSV